jgi:F-type H+-transporting ATPase subunit epsilon
VANAHVLLCEIVTPERIVYTNEVEMVVVPTLEGEVGVLPLHAPMVAALGAGEVRVKYDTDQVEWFAISGGYLQVHEDKVIILADDAQVSSQIDVDRARQAEELAAKRLAEMKDAKATAADIDAIQHEIEWRHAQMRVGAHR